MIGIALVTGAGGGLGTAICKVLAKKGFRIIAVDLLEEEKLKNQLSEIRASLELIFGGVDFSKPEVVTAIVESFLPNKNWTVLVNNAGISIGGKLIDGTLEQWNAMMNVNLTVPFVLSQAFVRNVNKTGGGGSIINISSMAGIIGAKKPGYAASKAGLIGLTKAVAMQVGPNIRCNAVYPGAMNTPMTADWDQKTRQAIAKNTPIGRIAEPEEIAQIVAFLADSEQSGFLTGAIINATGGQYLGQ
ncbi:MAG: SDR family oxidoreductase [Patescibacteria group bacterium]|nr:SDR family oxidoreductase [Patescibacteria group bacterium]